MDELSVGEIEDVLDDFIYVRFHHPAKRSYRSTPAYQIRTIQEETTTAAPRSGRTRS